MMRSTSTIRYVRFATRYHMAAAGALFLEAFGPHGYGEDWTLETSLKYLAERPVDTKYSYAAKTGDRVVGVILAHPVTEDGGRKLFIELVAVASDCRGAGIGTHLWRLAIRQAKTDGFIGVELSTSRSLRAYGWYRKLGFTDNGWIEMEKAFR
jgi:ribosomal protein S18 acetylase RimI-like enzyme